MDPIQEELRTARLTALQNQISPHYIVNSLEAIRMKLILDGQLESAELLRCLQTSLKTYGFSPDTTVTLSQELTFLEDTLKLYRFRFLGKLTWDFSIPAEAENLQIPRFMLQPILENALRYGLHGDMDHPHIQIGAFVAGGILTLAVTDNGTGFDTQGQSCGVGLGNVKERLKLLYGDDARIEIHSAFHAGTCVKLCLPVKGSAAHEL